MITYPCPHCEMLLEADEQQVGAVLICPGCEQQTIVPNRAAAGVEQGAAAPPMTPQAPASPPAGKVSGVTVPILISAISNILLGLGWISSCFGFMFAIPLIILCIFEFMLFTKASTLPPQELAQRAKTIGILEIIAIVLGNLVSLICGIIVLVNAGKVGQVRPAG